LAQTERRIPSANKVRIDKNTNKIFDITVFYIKHVFYFALRGVGEYFFANYLKRILGSYSYFSFCTNLTSIKRKEGLK